MAIDKNGVGGQKSEVPRDSPLYFPRNMETSGQWVSDPMLVGVIFVGVNRDLHFWS
jgi:hypothetical protein